MNTKSKVLVYLPNDTPPILHTIIFGAQHVLTMFSATVFVPAFCGFHIGPTLLAAGLGTIICAILSKLTTKSYIPLFYGSSFSYIAAYLAIAQAMTGELPKFGVPLPDEVISTIQAGILLTSFLNLLAGYLMMKAKKGAIDKIIPPVITGSVVAVIGFVVLTSALGMAFNNWAVAGFTILAIFMLSKYLVKGLAGKIQILLGIAAGCLFSAIFFPNSMSFSAVVAAPLLQFPHLTLPLFIGPFVGTAVFMVGINAIATLPESTAHFFTISALIDKEAENKGEKPYNLAEKVGLNTILDAINDFINALVGSPAGTNYGENISLQLITHNYSGVAVIAAGIIAVILAFVGKLQALVSAIPIAVSGGTALFIFSTVGIQGLFIYQNNKVDFGEIKNIILASPIWGLAIGATTLSNGLLPIKIAGLFPNGLPSIATGVVISIVLNQLFNIIDKKHS